MRPTNSVVFLARDLEQVFRLASVPAEHKMTKTQVKFEKNHHHCRTQRRWQTTFARDFLPAEAKTLRFINADLIAAGLAPFNPETASFKAGRLMLEEIDECVDAGHSFAFETTLSGMALLEKNRLVASSWIPS